MGASGAGGPGGRGGREGVCEGGSVRGAGRRAEGRSSEHRRAKRPLRRGRGGEGSAGKRVVSAGFCLGRRGFPPSSQPRAVRYGLTGGRVVVGRMDGGRQRGGASSWPTSRCWRLGAAAPARAGGELAACCTRRRSQPSVRPLAEIPRARCPAQLAGGSLRSRVVKVVMVMSSPAGILRSASRTSAATRTRTRGRPRRARPS